MISEYCYLEDERYPSTTLRKNLAMQPFKNKLQTAFKIMFKQRFQSLKRPTRNPIRSKPDGAGSLESSIFGPNPGPLEGGGGGGYGGKGIGCAYRVLKYSRVPTPIFPLLYTAKGRRGEKWRCLPCHSGIKYNSWAGNFINSVIPPHLSFFGQSYREGKLHYV